MTPQEKAAIGHVFAAMAVVNAYAKGLTNSMPMAVLAADFPQVAIAVAIAKKVEAGVDAVESAAPVADKLEPMIARLIAASGMTAADTARLRQQHIDQAEGTGI